MSIIAGTQQTVYDPDLAFPGDYYGIQSGVVHEQGYIASDTIGVATFCWFAGNNFVTQEKGTSFQLAGFVVRDQDNIIPYGDTSQGYGFAIPSNQRISISRNGSFFANITTSGNAGGVINNGDAVYVHNVTGALAVGESSNSSYTETDFLIINNSVRNNYGLNEVVISNQVQATATLENYRSAL